MGEKHSKYHCYLGGCENCVPEEGIEIPTLSERLPVDDPIDVTLVGPAATFKIGVELFGLQSALKNKEVEDRINARRIRERSGANPYAAYDHLTELH